MMMGYKFLSLLLLVIAFVMFSCGDGDEPPANDLQEEEVAVQDTRIEVPGFTYLNTETFSCGGVSNTVDIYLHEKTGLEFVLVPGGRFLMGSPDTEEERWSTEGPQHPCAVDSFMICRTECTQEAWDRIGGNDKRKTQDSRLPINWVSWEEGTKWCTKAKLRLPSEAEWEYACRAGQVSRFFFGDSELELDEFAWYLENSDGQVHHVALKKPNAFGLFDVIGNVSEWCQDRHGQNYKDASSSGDAWDLGKSPHRQLRGGHFYCISKHCRSAARSNDVYNVSKPTIGFRPACSLP